MTAPATAALTLWLAARRCPPAKLWVRPEDGHISVLNSGAAALAWLRERAG